MKIQRKLASIHNETSPTDTTLVAHTYKITSVILTLGGGSNRIRSSRPASGTRWVPSQPGIHYSPSQINTHKLKSESSGAPILVFLAALRRPLALTYLPSLSRKSRYKTGKQPKHTNR